MTKQLENLVWAAVLLVAVGASTSCATNPATGNRQIMLISEQQEIAMGRQEDENVVSAMGLYDDQSVQDYVERLGMTLARSSERPHLPWSFKVVDDPIVNAFALPGGYIYITRGILAHMGSEAQLVSVLGHEIGHVTARHSANQISKAQLANIGLGLGVVVAPEIGQAASLLQAGTGLLFLKFSRDDERQADDLGLRYAAKNGYDLREATRVHETLDVASSQEGTGRPPGWASTHPEPGNRIARIEAQIAEMGQDPQSAVIGRERFLGQLEGMTYGDNPREGYFDDRRYYHPELAFQFDIPQDWIGVNQKSSAGALSPNRDAVVVLRLSEHADPMQAAREFGRETSVRAEQPQRGEFAGLPAVWMGFEGTSGSTPISGRVAFVRHEERTFELLGYTATSNWGRYQREIDRSVQSFAPVSDRRVLNMQPARLTLVTLPRAMTLRQFEQQYPSPIELDELAVINQVEPDRELTGGMIVKRVVGGPGGN